MPRVRPSIDHEGTAYDSISAMARAWGINEGTYRERMRLGWSIKGALTNTPDGSRLPMSSRHIWLADGRHETGEPRMRCYQCGMLRSWAGASDPCSRALVTPAQIRANKKRKHQEKWKVQKASLGKMRESIAAERAEWFAERQRKQ